MHKEKTAIVMLGAGMRSAHGAGFLYTLAAELGITAPDLMLASSANAGSMAYFVAGQYENVKHVWCDLLSTPKFISPLRFWRIMDVDYLIDTVFKKLEPLDLEKLRVSHIRWLVSVTDYLTGIPRYVGREDALNIFDVLRASKAVPIFYRRPVFLEGKRYIDGEVGPMLLDHVEKIRAEGATRILIINHTPNHTFLRRVLMKTYGEFVGPNLRGAIIKDISSNTTCISILGAQVLCVAPRNLPAGTATRNIHKLRATFERGRQDALAMREELYTLFNLPSHESHRAQEGADDLRTAEGVRRGAGALRL